MSDIEDKKQEEKDRYRFGGYHWEDNGKNDLFVPNDSIKRKPEPLWWGKKATWSLPA